MYISPDISQLICLLVCFCYVTEVDDTAYIHFCFVGGLKKMTLLSHWDPSKLTHLNRYFDEDNEVSLSKYLWKCVYLL